MFRTNKQTEDVAAAADASESNPSMSPFQATQFFRRHKNKGYTGIFFHHLERDAIFVIFCLLSCTPHTLEKTISLLEKH